MHVELLLSNYADSKTLLFVVCWEYMSFKKKFISFKFLHDYYYLLGLKNMISIYINYRHII